MLGNLVCLGLFHVFFNSKTNLDTCKQKYTNLNKINFLRKNRYIDG